MKLKNEVLINNRFNDAVGRLLHERVPGKVAYNLNAVVKAIPQQMELFETTRKGLLNRFCKKNEDGTLEVNDGIVTFIDEESETSFKTEFKSLSETEFEIPVSKLVLPEDIKISTADYMALVS